MFFWSKEKNWQIAAMFQLSRSIDNLAKSMNDHTKKEYEMVERVCKTLDKVSQRERDIAELIKIVNY